MVQPAYVEMLAAADGPAGDATALLLAFFLARQYPDEGVRLLLRMAARGDLPVVALGRQLALLTTRTEVKLPHATAGLEQAARQGAHWEVWAVIRAGLPHLLPGGGGQTGHRRDRPHHPGRDGRTVGRGARRDPRADGGRRTEGLQPVHP